MDGVLNLITPVFTRAPYAYLAWPAVAMILGTLLGVLSSRLAAQLSVVPRTADGLLGIVTAPFVHANLAHLAANLPPFIVLGGLMLGHGTTQFLEAALIITLGQGLLLWLLGRPAAHAGMSGVIFGFFGFLIAVAYFTRTTHDLLVAGGILLVYGGMLAGIAPARSGVSWEGHLFGLVAGLGTAWILVRL